MGRNVLKSSPSITHPFAIHNGQKAVEMDSLLPLWPFSYPEVVGIKIGMFYIEKTSHSWSTVVHFCNQCLPWYIRLWTLLYFRLHLNKKMLVYRLYPLEWIVEWVNNAEIGERFKGQEIDGQTLLQSERILKDNSMEVQALSTIGKKDKFTTSVAKFRGILAIVWLNDFFRKRPKFGSY